MGKHTHKHNHCHCAHDVEYCPICDVCYCKKCGKEWGRYKYWYTYTQPYIYPNISWEYNTISSGNTTVKCNHSTA